MKYYAVLIFFCLSCYLRAQDNSTLPEEKYREDQWYANFSFLLANESIENFRLNGFSYAIGLGFIRDIPLNIKSNRAIGIGLGYGLSSYGSNLALIKREPNPYEFSLNEMALLDSENRLVTHSIEMPIEYRWRTSTASTHAFWRVYAGYIIRYNFNSRLNIFDGLPVTTIDEVNKFSHALKVSMGYNTWNIYLEYNISSYFKSGTQTNTGTPLELNAIKAGLIFYVL